MLTSSRARFLFALAALALPGAAAAHGFGQLYNLPVPFWLYGWGAASALVFSFLLVGYFAATPMAAPAPQSRDLTDAAWVRALRRALPGLKAFSVFLLLLCMATGLFGIRDPYRNFSMTFFWVVFVLAYAYLTALIGDTFAVLNPWRVLADGLGRFWRGFTRGRVRYPAEKLGDWPAVALYLAFIWYELFNLGKPFALGVLLVGYTLLNLAGVWLVGAAAWFRHCELFSVFLRLLALMSPLDFRRSEAPGQRSTLRWRWPFAGLVQERPGHLSTVVFVLATLSTTAFDGLRATQRWVAWFWNADGVGYWLTGDLPIRSYATLRPLYAAWETCWLVVSPFLYLGAYGLALLAAKALTRSPRPLSQLALDFGYTLLPIALVYNVTHYSTLLLTQGIKVFSLFSDPFGRGWNLLGTARLWRIPILPDMGVVWHSQVGLILAGHIASVWVAHLMALRVWPTRRQAIASQLPMLALMVLFTVVGLWILAMPLTAMTMR